MKDNSNRLFIELSAFEDLCRQIKLLQFKRTKNTIIKNYNTNLKVFKKEKINYLQSICTNSF